MGRRHVCARPLKMFYDIDAEVASVYPYDDAYDGIISSERVILKTGVLLFCATKLIVLARRVKERMYAPGGIGFIAAQETLTVPPSRSALNDSHAPLNLRGEPRDPQKSCDKRQMVLFVSECSSTPLFWVYDEILLLSSSLLDISSIWSWLFRPSMFSVSP